MKKMVSMAVLALLAMGCSSDDTNEIPVPETPVNADVIRINQTVEGMTASKAAVVNGSDVTASVLMRDGSSQTWEGFTVVKENTIETEAVTARATVSTATFTVGDGKAIGLNPTLYYDKNNASTEVFLAAVAPAGTINGTTVTMQTTDGEQDVMFAEATSVGTYTSHEGPYSLTFAHKTTQLKFAIRLEAELSKAWKDKNVTLKSITIRDAQLPKSVNVADGTLGWTSPSSLIVPNIVTVGVTSTTPVNVGNPVMINASGSVILNVVITVGDEDKSYNEVLVTDTEASGSGALTTLIGSSHLITLTLTEPEKVGDGEAAISTNATVTEWSTGHTGGADLK